MADGKFFIENLIYLMEQDTDLQTCINKKIDIFVADFKPVGNRYPQISLWLDQGQSETIFPAGHYKLTIGIWIKKDELQRYKKCLVIAKCVNAIVNRKASSLSDIDVTNNEGLRVARCVKDGGDIMFSKQTGLYVNELCYDMVISEGEDFTEDTAGNRPWV